MTYHSWARRISCLLLGGLLFVGLIGCSRDPEEAPSSSDPGSSTAPAVINADQPAGDITITADPGVTHQTIEWFGASGCWTGKIVDELPEAKLDELMDLLFNKETGIGLTSWRYNIGGGEPIVQNHDVPHQVTNCLEVAPGQYDLERDAFSIDLMQKAVDRGATHVTLFINSPPARMTNSNSTSGMPDGSSNLNPAYNEEFAAYAADITALFIEAGFPVDYISPINEPQWKWGEDHSQEGCHYEVDQLLEVDLLVAKELKARGLDVKVAVPETAAWYDRAYTNNIFWELASGHELAAYIDHFCGHSYGSDTNTKRVLAQYLEQFDTVNLPIRQTEWCSDTTGSAGAVELSRVIHEDLTILDCVSWDFWVAMAHDAWSLIRVNGTDVQIAPRLYALGNYSKFITGATRIDCAADAADDSVFSSAYVTPDGKQTVVIVTNDAMKNQTISFAGTPFEGKTARLYRTSIINQLEYLGDVSADHGVELFFQSVNTFVFDNE